MAFPQLFSLPPVAVAAGYLAGYVLLDWISFIQPFAPFGITPWNPPTGLSFVLVLLFGQRFIPLLFAAPLLADLLVRRLPLPWSVEILVTLVVAGGYSAGLFFLLKPQTRFHPALTSMRDLILLIAVAAASSAFVAISYVAVLVESGLLSPDRFVAGALQFWIGDMIGIAVTAPFGLILLTRRRPLTLSSETAIQYAGILIALALVFIYAESHHFQLFYLLFLPIIWTAVRGGLESVAVAILITQVGLIVGLHMIPQTDVSIIAFQALMLVLTMTGLVAGVLVAEQRRTEFQLRLHQDSVARIAQLGTMGELTTAVAHEINQPLMAAGTYVRLVAETLRADRDSDPEALEAADKAVAQVERAAEVVRRLRALIRLDQSGRAPSPVERIVSETLDLCQPDLNRHSVTSHVALDPDLPAVSVDRLQIEQVLLNLVRNSIEAIREGGRGSGAITIKASRLDSRHVEMQVVDTGPGFPQGMGTAGLPLMSSTKPDGFGFGLSLSRSIVEAHGGSLDMPPGKTGAVVRFTLPVAEADHRSDPHRSDR